MRPQRAPRTRQIPVGNMERMPLEHGMFRSRTGTVSPPHCTGGDRYRPPPSSSASPQRGAPPFDRSFLLIHADSYARRPRPPDRSLACAEIWIRFLDSPVAAKSQGLFANGARAHGAPAPIRTPPLGVRARPENGTRSSSDHVLSGEGTCSDRYSPSLPGLSLTFYLPSP